MANYVPDVIRRLGSRINSRYLTDGLTTMENLGSDIRYVALPVALGLFLKSFNDNSVPDNLVTQSLYNPALVFGVGEFSRSVGYCLRELRDKSLTPVKAAGAFVRTATPFFLAYNVIDGSEGARGAIADVFPAMVGWGLGHATGTEHKKKGVTYSPAGTDRN